FGADRFEQARSLLLPEREWHAGLEQSEVVARRREPRRAQLAKGLHRLPRALPVRAHGDERGLVVAALRGAALAGLVEERGRGGEVALHAFPALEQRAERGALREAAGGALLPQRRRGLPVERGDLGGRGAGHGP